VNACDTKRPTMHERFVGRLPLGAKAAILASNHSLPFSPSAMLKRRPLLAPLLTLVLILCSVATISVGTFNTSVSASLNELQHAADQRLELYAAGMDGEIEHFARLPSILGLTPAINSLLARPGERTRQTEANRYLEQLTQRTGARAIYILDNHGQVVATSNWRSADSYLGENDAFRPYFQEALRGRPSRFFGIGTTRSEPGYYLSQALYDGTQRLGVAVVKISLAELENRWNSGRALIWVSDSNRVVILASRPEWKFATLGALSPAETLRLEQSRQYNRIKLSPIKVDHLEQLSPTTRIVHWHAREDSPAGSQRYLAQTRTLAGSNWKLTLLLSLGPVYTLALVRAALAAVLSILLLTSLFWVKERRRRQREKMSAREALQQAYRLLEHKVEQRTADLSASNMLLHAEIGERIRAEEHLRETQDELLQAGKLAVIGQLSTQVAHELNQPLAALRTLSGNTIKYLARGDLATASTNLETIGQLVERMGKITGALRSFARKSRGAGRAHLGQTLDHALLLLEQRITQQAVEIDRVPGQEDLLARVDPNRLEQVLINLLANALDALQDIPEPRIEIRCSHTDNQCLKLCVHDNGQGLSAAALAHLFEPFFTTKSADAGLGLGLALSTSIITEAGGTLAAANHPQGGAVFTLTLPQLPQEHPLD
jgi:C4-dicarboxylate-specific signal transduction histidine kinase